jgi:hypothetical protein
VPVDDDPDDDWCSDPPGQRMKVARRLVRAMADEHLVEREHALPVVERRLHHRPLVDRRCPAGRRRDERRSLGREVLREEGAVTDRVRVDPDDRLAVEVLRHVGDEPRRPDRDDDVGGLEQKPVEIGPLDARPPPVRRDGHATLQRLPLGRVAARHLVDPPSALEEEPRLARACRGARAGGVLGRPGDHDDPRDRRVPAIGQACGSGCASARPRAGAGGEQVGQHRAEQVLA